MADEEESKTPEKKSRVLHTRVPAILERELKNLATSLKVPVSNVVRAILEDAIDTMDLAATAAQDELRSVADRLKGKPPTPRTPKPPLADAIGVAHMVLMRETTCGLTGRVMAKGEAALLVHFDDGRPPLVVAEDAVPSASSEALP